MLTLIDWGSVIRFHHCKVSLYFSLSRSALQKKVSLCSSSIKSEELWSPIWGQSIYVNYLEFFCMGDSSLSWYSFIYINMDSWDFPVVQWFRLCPSNARGTGLIPGWELRSHMSHGVTKNWKTKQNHELLGICLIFWVITQLYIIYFATHIGIGALWAWGTHPFGSCAPLTHYFGLNVCVSPLPLHIHMLKP